MPQSDRALFDRFALRILAMLQEAFPVEIALRPYDIVREENLKPAKHTIAICDRTLSWLRQEEFFRSPGTVIGGPNPELQTIYTQARLTTKGLAALDTPIEFSGKWDKAGQFVAKQAAETATEVRNAAVSDLVGRVIGGAAKAFLSQ